MSLEADIRAGQVILPDKPPPAMEAALSSFPLLTSYLAKEDNPILLANLLHWELQGMRRPSYINRIYGRYHKVINKRDFQYIYSILPEALWEKPKEL
jgi:hypothetical protein